jgi:hypothetical protein
LKAAAWLAAALACLAVLAAACWAYFLPSLVERELRTVTGFDVTVEVLRVNPFTGNVFVKGLSAANPSGYPSPTFFELRELRADVNVFSWFFGKEFVVNELDIDTAKIDIVRQHDGRSNAAQFMAAFSRPAGAGDAAAPSPPRPYLVRKLHIRLSELDIEDYSGPNSYKKVYHLNIDQSYADVSSARQLLVPRVVKTLYSFGLRRDVAQLLPGDFGKALAAAIGEASAVGSELKGALMKAFDKLEQRAKP